MLRQAEPSKVSVTAIPLKNNYDVWADIVKWDLIALGLWKAVAASPSSSNKDGDASGGPSRSARVGSEEDAGTTVEKAASTTVDKVTDNVDNARAIMHIKARVPVEHLPLLLHIDSAHALWGKIKDLFGMRSDSLSMQLDSEFSALAMKPGEDVLAYLNRSAALRAKLASIDEDVKDTVFFRRVLAGLRALPGDPYETQVNLLLSHANLGQLTMEMMATLLQQREVDIRNRNEDMKSNDVLYMHRAGGSTWRTRTRGRGRGHSGPFQSHDAVHRSSGARPSTGACWRCEGPGHIAKHCPNVIIRCWKCKGTGHAPNDCDARVNNMAVDENEKEANTCAVEMVDNAQVILDSGASHNVCPNAPLLTR